MRNLLIMAADKKCKKEKCPTIFYSNIICSSISFAIFLIIAKKYIPFNVQETDISKLQNKNVECQTKLLKKETKLHRIEKEKDACINERLYIQELYESLHVKLEDALKEKLVALEDRLNLLTQLRDSEQSAADTEAFIKIMKSECESKQDLLDITIKENRSLEKLMREQSKQLHEQSEEIIMLKKLFINS